MTLTDFTYKPDWVKAQMRWDAFWELEPTDRPCLNIRVPRTDGREVILPELRSSEDRWFNPEYVLAQSLKYLEGNYLCGEMPPAAPYFMAGTAMGCGNNLEFHEGGISICPSMDSMDQPLGWHPGPDDPWRLKVEIVCRRLLDKAAGRFIVPCPAQFEHIDLLNMLRGNSEMLLDMATEPGQCIARLHEMRMPSYENSIYIQRMLDSRQGDVGYLSWTNIWGRKFFKCVQADAAAMISPEMFDNFVLPELNWQGEHFGRLHYHTCGYKQHLVSCLSCPYIRVIQYSPNPKEPPNGPAHLDFYRRVQQSGKCLDIDAGPENVEFLIRHLRPEGLAISTSAGSNAEAGELTANAVRWAGSHVDSLI